MPPAFAAAPSTSCPSGYTAVDIPYITIATNCPSGTQSAGTTNSCLSGTSGPYAECYMFAPVGVSYTDSTGTYEYTEPCTMK